MEFRILGPVEAVRDGGPVALGGTRKSLLALLLLHPNESISTERLIEELWGERAPPTALRMLRNAVSQLRRLLDEERLTTRAGGYELRVGPDELDAFRFERLARAGREQLAADDPGGAAESLAEALALWRGPALAEFVYAPFAHAAVARLEESRLDALEDRIEAELELGRHGDLLGELEALVVEQPLRERLRAQLMLALYRSGRQAEALGVFQQTRKLLVDELGIEPGPALRRMEQAILRHDASLESPERQAEPAAVSPTPVPQRETRRSVTLVAVDLAAAEEDDPDARSARLAAGTATVEEVLATHVAGVRRTDSGKLLAVFGVPEVREDDALRALHAAAELRSRLGESARVAVATGDVIAGAGPIEGAVVARALRLVEAAPPGDVLVGPETARLVRGAATLEPLTDGGARLVDLTADAPAIARRFGTPLVGRVTELRQLQDALARADEAASTELFTVLGVAGVGKSKLALEFAGSLAGSATVLTGRALSYGEGITYWPLREIVLAAFGPDVERGIAALLADDPEAEAVAARVAGTVGLAEAAAPREETFRAVRRTFEALAADRPVVLVIEDLHWAEPTFLDLVEHLTELGRAPILLVALARPELLEQRPLWAGGRPRFRSVLVEPLSQREADELIDALVAEPLSPEERAAIATTAEGNPLFLEQMVALREDHPQGDEPGVPPTIQALLASRLERLSASERAVLERAAVVGRSFSADVVAELSPEDERSAVHAAVESLVRRDFLRPDATRRGEDTFRFAHGLVREVAYESVPKRTRAELHERIAERAAPVVIEEIVAYHLEAAHRYRRELIGDDEHTRELARKASDRLASAGRRAHARGDVPAAAGLLSRSAALLEREDERAPAVLSDLVEALREAGDFVRARATADELAAAAERSGDPVVLASAALVRHRLEIITGAVDTDQLQTETRAAVEVLERAHAEPMLAKAWELLALFAWLACRAEDTEQALEHAIRHARAAEDPRALAQSLSLMLGAGLFGPTRVPQAIERCEAILADAGVQRRISASALRALGGLYAMEGRFDDAREALAESRAILDDLGLRVLAAHVAETEGLVEMLAGDAEAAEAALRLGYEQLEAIGERFNFANLAALLAGALSTLGRDEEALRLAATAAQATAPDDLSGQIHWRIAQARALAGLGRVAEAEPIAREAVRLAEQTDFLNVHADALIALATLWKAAGRDDEAVVVARLALDLYERKGNVVSAASTRELLNAESAASWRATR